jgi:hypothetical protein
MTRSLKSLPVDPPSGGLDLRELRRSLGVSAPAPLRDVTGSDVSAEARSRLKRLRGARQAALEQLAELDSTIARADAAIARTQVAQATMTALENEAAAATRRWVAGGARGDAPSLSAAQRQALEAARADYLEAERRRANVETGLVTLRANRTAMAEGIARADAEIRQVAALAVAAEAHTLIQQLRQEREAERATRIRLFGLKEFCGSLGMDAWTQIALITDGLRAAARQVEHVEVEAVAREYEDMVCQLAAGEELS